MSLAFDIELQRGDFVLRAKAEMQPGLHILTGPSGSGKSSLLRLLAGFLLPERGFVTCGNTPWFRAEPPVCLPAYMRGVGMAFQADRLFPHLNVINNARFGAAPGRDPDDLLRTMGLSELAQRSSTEVSGGQARRLAVARGLLALRTLGLFDEPFAGLDAELARVTADCIGQAATEQQLPIVLTTHRFGLLQGFDASWWHLDDGHLKAGPPKS